MTIVTSFYCRIVERELQRAKFDLTGLYSGMSYKSEDVHEVAQVPIDEFTVFLANAIEISGNPGLGLVIGTHTRLAGLGEMGIAALSAPTILDGLQVIETYSRIHSGLSELFMTVDARDLIVTVNHFDDSEYAQIYSEVFALLVQNYIEEILGAVFETGQYYFSHPRPDYFEQYETALHCSFKFDCQTTTAKIPYALLKERSPYYDVDIWNQSLQQCSNTLETLRKTESTTYSMHLAALFRSSPLPLPSFTEVAKRLCLSERSLSRKLKEEGTNYRCLSNDILEVRACEFLDNTGLSVDAIAAQMGFQDAANFRRAFKSWQGCSPGDYRTRSSTFQS